MGRGGGCGGGVWGRLCTHNYHIRVVGKGEVGRGRRGGLGVLQL
jgi:hypothetical protein